MPRPPGSPSALDAIAAPLVDAASLAAFFWLVPSLVRLLGLGGHSNALLVVCAYVLLCLGVLLGRALMEPPVPAGFGERTARYVAWLVWPFSIFVLAMLYKLTGGSGGAEASLFDGLVSGGPLSVILLSLLALAILLAFPLCAILPVRRSIPCGGWQHTTLKLLSLVLVNSFVLITAAYWQWSLAGAAPLGQQFGGRVFVVLALFPLFLAFNSAPRLVLLSLDSNGWGALSYTALLGVVFWNLPL